VFINGEDLCEQGLRAGDWVDLTSVYGDGRQRTVRRFLLVEHAIPRGCLASYYPETNPLVALDSHAAGAGTPASKAVPVVLTRTTEPADAL
jgi:anaerobic selenocysteine-containing dehydrogenase